MTTPPPTGDLMADRVTDLRAAMVDAIGDQLTDAAWRAAFAAVPRHLLVPVFYRMRDYRRIDSDDPADREAWLEEVYRDQTLITQIQPHAVTSSGTMPGLVAAMLHALDVEQGDTVLQLGTGTGYTAALVCHRLGSVNVVTVDVDPELTATAQRRLHAAGYDPTVVTADGALGYAPLAPYDRLLVTFGNRHIPAAWLTQLRHGGRLVAPIRAGLAQLRIGADSTAEGRYLATPGYFMSHRATPDAVSAQPAAAQHPVWPPRQPAQPSSVVYDNSFRFVLSLLLPDLTYGNIASDLYDIELTDTDGSTVRLTPDGELTQRGPRPLWDLVEQAHDTWTALGRPGRERFGLSATPDEQWVWLDEPDSRHRWPLAVAGQRPAAR